MWEMTKLCDSGSASLMTLQSGCLLVSEGAGVSASEPTQQPSALLHIGVSIKWLMNWLSSEWVTREKGKYEQESDLPLFHSYCIC